MLAAFVAPGEALIDAVGVGLVGDDEDTSLGARCCTCREEQTREESGEESHEAPMSERTAFIE